MSQPAAVKEATQPHTGNSEDVSARPIARATWRRSRFWLILLLVVVIGAVLVAIVTRSAQTATQPIDPSSPSPDGSLALARLLGARGTDVSALSSPGDAANLPTGTTILIVDADDLGADQLQDLRGHRLVVLDPDIESLAALTSANERDDVAGGDAVDPGCTWPGAQAAGPVTFPAGTDTYTGSNTCYGGAVVITDQLVVLGSVDLLRNDELASNNVAALDINAISNDGAVTKVAWLMPGFEDTGSGSPSVWALFPPWAQRAFWWLLVVGVLLALWRGRRLGPVVAEPLPVIVRSAEVVEGHGRLYRRAGARERAAALLRAATTARLANRLGLDRRTSPAELAMALSHSRPVHGTSSSDVLVGPAPIDDAALVKLADELAVLDATTGVAIDTPIAGTGSVPS